MSVEAFSRTLAAPLGGNPKVILLGLANHAHPDGTNSYPAIDRLATYCHCDRRTAQRNIRKLEADGFIARDGFGPKGQTNWRLCFEKWESEGRQNAAPRQNATAASEHRGGGIPGLEGAAPMPPEPSIEPSIEPKERAQARGPLSGGIEQKADRVGFSDWLADHADITALPSSKPGTATRKSLASAYVACHAELQANGIEPVEGLRRATRNAFADEFRREHGNFRPENVLRVTKIVGLVQRQPRPALPRQPDDHRPAAGSGYWSEAEEREKLMAQRRAGANYA